MKRIAICTGGGDAPGLNAVIRAVVLSALNRGWECYGIHDGLNGLLMPDQYADGGLISLTRESVRGITHLGGTILGTTNRGNPMHYPMLQADGTIREVDRMPEIAATFRARQLEALVSIGGDGSMRIAHALSLQGVPVVGVPKTIDNDLDGTEVTFGFDTAVAFATECLDRLHSTAESHGRIMVVEVMGRYSGWIALHSGIAGSADVILIPEIPYDLECVRESLQARAMQGRHFGIVVAAEGAKPRGGSVSVIDKPIGHNERLGGVGSKLTQELEQLTGRETRLVVLGHLLRGGSPTALDRLMALRFGAAAVRALDEGHSGVMVALNPPCVNHVPLEQVIAHMKSVPFDCDTIQTGRDLGICFGD